MAYPEPSKHGDRPRGIRAISHSLRRALDQSRLNPLGYRVFWRHVERQGIKVDRERAWADLTINGEYDPAQAAITRDMAVLSGPFTSMRYPDPGAVCSTFLPKLIGSYECELHQPLQRALQADYDTVLDIGCAEGYYAVGFALKLRCDRVLAYDTDLEARRRCAAMAAHNGVPDRVDVREACTRDDLLALAGQRALVFSDCEGYENDLFDPQVARALADAVVFIESHDNVRTGTTDRLRAALGDTHRLETRHSISDAARPQFYDCPLLDGFPDDVRIACMAERRPTRMRWLVAWPR